MNENRSPIPSRLYNAAKGGHVAGTADIIDDNKGKTQEVINKETDSALENRYTKNETYSKTELNNLITTPEQKYVTLTAKSGDILENIFDGINGAANTVYRVGSWDGNQYNTTKYAEYGWTGTNFVPLDVKEYGIDDEPIAGSENLVKSGGVAKAIEDEANKRTAETSSLQNKTEKIECEDIKDETKEAFVIKSNSGNVLLNVDENGLDAKNVKSNGKSVLTKDEIDTLSDEGIELQTNDGKRITSICYEEGYDNECVSWKSDDGKETYAAVTPNGIKCKNITLLDGTDLRYKDLAGKTLLAIGDSVTASGAYDTTPTSWQSFLGKKLGIKIKNHAKGGIGIIEMCDGTENGDNPDADPNGFGVDYLPPLSAEELADVNYVIMLGFFNEIGKYPDKEMDYGEVTDVYIPGGNNTVCAKLNHLVDRVYECIKATGNEKCKLIIVSPYKYGCYPYGLGTGYDLGAKFCKKLKEFAEYHSIYYIDLMGELGINKYTWNVYTVSQTIYNQKYISANGELGVNSPFSSVSELPTNSIDGSFATVGTTEMWDVYKKNSKGWEIMQSGCTLTREYESIQGKHVGGYIWNADNLHPSLEGRKYIGNFISNHLNIF